MNDEALWEAFTTCTLPSAAWTHVAHLRVAWLHLRRYPFDDAHTMIRVGIVRLNASHGLVETPTRGYHETITRAFLTLLAARMKTVTADDSLAFLQGCGEELPSALLLRHYTREHLLSPRARAIFVEPDLEPLPRSG